MTVERRSAAVEFRIEGRRLSGTVMRYGTISPSHRERFEPGSLRLAGAVHLDLDHDPERAVAWHPGGGLAIENGRDSMTMRAELPPIPAADRALADIRDGKVTGLSVEFRAVRERRDGDLRVIEEAVLSGIAIVRSPSYSNARVEARRRSGRTMRARIPVGRKLECRCAGAACKFARVTGAALRDEFELAFGQARKEIIAGFNSYDMPIASRSSGTLRGRVLANGDGEVEIDLPDDAVGAAVLAAHSSAGVIVRPHIDARAAESAEEGDTLIYRKAPIRAFLVSATDAREGWPVPELIATAVGLDELASVAAPRARKTPRWL